MCKKEKCSSVDCCGTNFRNARNDITELSTIFSSQALLLSNDLIKISTLFQQMSYAWIVSGFTDIPGLLNNNQSVIDALNTTNTDAGNLLGTAQKIIVVANTILFDLDHCAKCSITKKEFKIIQIAVEKLKADISAFNILFLSGVVDNIHLLQNLALKLNTDAVVLPTPDINLINQDLTNMGDVLIAIQGVSKQIEQISNDILTDIAVVSELLRTSGLINNCCIREKEKCCTK